jgi:hypothetical protein
MGNAMQVSHAITDNYLPANIRHLQRGHWSDLSGFIIYYESK